MLAAGERRRSGSQHGSGTDGGTSHGTCTMSSIDWEKWGAPAVLITLIAFVVSWIKPALSNGLHYLWRADPAKAVETAMVVWKTDAGRLQMREYLRDVLKEELALSKKALDIAEANHDTLEQVKHTQIAQGVTMNQIEESVDKVPQMTDALQRIGESMKTFAEHMETVSDFMSRADERERLRERYERGQLPERRHHQIDPHPHDRREDKR